jgi:malate dehydrogenase (oxaloacetate-decarboxylating)(NADP+)
MTEEKIVMKAIVVTDQAAGTAAMKPVERPEPQAAIPVHYNGQTFFPGQANNFYIFPAVGMAIFATQAKRVTDKMFNEAAQAVADQVPSGLLKQGLLYPLQSNILETEIQTAARVAKLVFDS